MHPPFAGLCALLVLACPLAAAQVYKQTDPSGRVTYSDKPPPGSAVSRESADPMRELQGTWHAASLTFEGAPRPDEKIVGGKWSFNGSELSVEQANGEKGRFALRFEAGSQPRAFFATPIAPSPDRGNWMIYAHDGDRLRIAFFDGKEGRPSGFEPQRKLAVVTLVTTGSPSVRAAKTSACNILRAAGVMELIGRDAQVDPARIKDPATQCYMAQPMGIVGLQLIPATQRAALDKQREKEEKDGAMRAARTVVKAEPELGPSAFSVRIGNSLTIWTHKGDTIVALSVQIPASTDPTILSFTKRILAQL